MKNQLLLSCLFLIGGLSLFSCRSEKDKPRPNVIIVITDDQGYGDLACHGNPYLQTPHLDQLHKESMRFTDFHVGTTCAPSRAGLMTGQYCNKVGAWHTINGREMVWREETLFPELFKEAGYATAMFGKWHLGDNYPYRPQDRGFDEVLVHGGGGVGQTPDFWNNDYFDDTYFHNGVPEKKEGYCTDVWFESALKFIEKHKAQPFFCYISTNAPHSPYYVDTTYSQPYRGNDNIVSANFYGMIANIDEHMGSLRQKLTDWGIADNTILVFLTDNGSAAGCTLDPNGQVEKGYNAGMRGKKGSPYEGGHRVPLFIYWKDGNIMGGRDIDKLVANIDLAPTLLDLAGITSKAELDFDGESLRPLMEGKTWNDRILFADTQRKQDLVKYKDYSVMTEDWRLVNGALYAIEKDPGQQEDVATENPAVVQELMTAYEAWWQHTSQRAADYCYIPLGKAVGDQQTINQHDLLSQDKSVAWNQGHIREGLATTGYWAIEVEEKGLYRFELRRWPKESGLKLWDNAPPGDLIPQGLAYKEGKSIDIIAASIAVGDQAQRMAVAENMAAATFTFPIAPGKYKLNANFIDKEEQLSSVYYVYTEKME
ncbi:MAG: arylsulfatase [Saprospiraceae bacterium]